MKMHLPHFLHFMVPVKITDLPTAINHKKTIGTPVVSGLSKNLLTIYQGKNLHELKPDVSHWKILTYAVATRPENCVRSAIKSTLYFLW